MTVIEFCFLNYLFKTLKNYIVFIVFIITFGYLIIWYG